MGVLKWELGAVTPHDILEQIVPRLPLCDEDAGKVTRHSQAIIGICAIDFEFACYSPSVIATMSLIYVLSNLMGPEWCHEIQLDNKLQDIIFTFNSEVVEELLHQWTALL